MSKIRYPHGRGWLPASPCAGSRPLRRHVLIGPAVAAVLIVVGCGTPQSPAEVAQNTAATTLSAVEANATTLVPTIEAAASEIAAAPGAAATAEAAASAVAATAQAARTDVAATVEAAAPGATATAQALLPTAEAAASAVAATVEAVQSEVAPTVEALQPTVEALETQVAERLTAVAPTVAALATDVAAAVQPAVATSVAASPIEITDVQVSQEDTTVALHNRGSEPVLIVGYVLLVGATPILLPVGPYPQLGPDETLTFHFARGVGSATDVYMGPAPQGLIDSLQSGTRLVLLSPRVEVASIYELP